MTRLTGLGGDSGQRLAALSARLDTLATGLSAQEDRLRDAERSLVDRIADVDDDRRRTLAQIQRAVQTQSEEAEERAHRQGRLTVLGLLLIAALAAGGLFLMHLQDQQRLEELQGDLTAELQTLGLELNRLKGEITQGDKLQERVAALSATMDRLSADLAATRASPRPEVPEETSRVGLLAEQVARLESHQQALITDMDALRRTLDAGTQPSAEPQTPAESPKVALLTEQIGRLESDQQGLATEMEALRRTLEAATQTPPEPQTPAESPRVALLTEQIGRLESDQQGLIAEIEALRRALEAAASAPARAPDAAQSRDAGPADSAEASAQRPKSQTEAGPDHQTGTGSEPAFAADQEGRGDAQAPDAGAEIPTPGQAVAPERRFALQLMGSYDRAALLAVAARADLPDSVFIRQETLRGRPWFVLIHSLHPTYAEAEAERDRLPESLPRRGIWIRSLPPETNLEPIGTRRAP